MAKNDNLKDFLTDLANTIREKKGTTAKINPQNFSSEIASISTSGGGDTPKPDMPVIGDGKTYLYIKIAAEGRMNIPLYFSQTVANGVTIDWGDGSATQTLSGTGNKSITHTYAEIGEYTISLNPSSRCTLGLGHNSTSYGILGITSGGGRVYCNMLQAVEIGNSVTSIGDYAFRNCYSLASIVIPNNVTSIGNNAFSDCYSLASIVIPNNVTSIGSNAFSNCYSLASIVIPNSVTSIGDFAFRNCYSLASIVIPNNVTSVGNNAFYSCYGMAFYDFSQCTSVPTLGGTSVFYNIQSDCKIVVPDSLYSSWSIATNWSTHASKMVKASNFNG
jgi:hypothetical protein